MKKKTTSPIGGSNDTEMVIFQNNQQHQEKTANQKSDFKLTIYTQKNYHAFYHVKF